MLLTSNFQTKGFVPKTNVTNEAPRDTYSFVNKLVHDTSFYNEFSLNPLKVFGENGFDTSKIYIPNDFSMPSQEELKERLMYIYSYEDFVSPAEMSSLPILPVVFIFIPIFAY
ncbi:hypothetical protein [Riemerella columbina]|uniref:hypothetical protein n=1 Tax=Riemerella columbina TaxID=103810 RepID=UPI0003674B7F|nr:hypothetical protein [Riemerella columbina]